MKEGPPPPEKKIIIFPHLVPKAVIIFSPVVGVPEIRFYLYFFYCIQVAMTSCANGRILIGFDVGIICAFRMVFSSKCFFLFRFGP